MTFLVMCYTVQSSLSFGAPSGPERLHFFPCEFEFYKMQHPVPCSTPMMANEKPSAYAFGWRDKSTAAIYQTRHASVARQCVAG